MVKIGQIFPNLTRYGQQWPMIPNFGLIRCWRSACGNSSNNAPGSSCRVIWYIFAASVQRPAPRRIIPIKQRCELCCSRLCREPMEGPKTPKCGLGGGPARPEASMRQSMQGTTHQEVLCFFPREAKWHYSGPIRNRNPLARRPPEE